jgi:hypothetical protein
MKLTIERVHDLIWAGNKDKTWLTPLNALVVACQTWHETGNYTHVCGEGNYNLAGIKCSDEWRYKKIPWSTGLCRSLNTGEFDGKKFDYGKRAFRVYTDPAQFLMDYSRLIAVKPWFADAKASHANCFGFLAGLCARWQSSRVIEPGWATSPFYYDRVTDAIVDHAPLLLGAGWRDKLIRSYQYAVRNDLLTDEQCRLTEKHLNI